MQVEGLDAAVANYINEIKAGCEQQIQEIQERLEYQEHQNHKLKNEAIEYQNKYLEIKERYDLLLYKQFMRSAEKLPLDDKQRLLFSSEAEPVETAERDWEEERTEVRSYGRGKPGRKPIDPRIPRETGDPIDIPEEEKTCACGARFGSA